VDPVMVALLVKEADRLLAIPTWLEETVVELSTLMKDARKHNRTIHTAHCFSHLYCKHSEAFDVTLRKYKARLVLAEVECARRMLNEPILTKSRTHPGCIMFHKNLDGFRSAGRWGDFHRGRCDGLRPVNAD
jgi:hypothetical protein